MVWGEIVTIAAISGFMGLKGDWKGIDLPLVPVEVADFPLANMHQWAKYFNQWASSTLPPHSVLMGYSLGGRLALHALVAARQKWDAAIFISCHPGLEPSQRPQRFQSDALWAERFEKDPWDILMQQWNSQQVFASDSFFFQRQESRYLRPVLAQQLRAASLSAQEDFRGPIAALPMPVLWLTGGRDQRYCKLAESLSFRHPLSKREVIGEAGHRLVWSHPSEFTYAVSTFMHLVGEGSV